MHTAGSQQGAGPAPQHELSCSAALAGPHRWRARDLGVKRSKVRGGNGRGERAGKGWDQREGEAKETEGERRKQGRYLAGGWRHSRCRPTLGGLGFLVCLVCWVQHLLLLPLQQ